MREAVATGSKRKRVVSGSENALANGRSRSGNRVKRCRASHSSDEDEQAASSMDVDGHSRWELTDSDASDDEDVDSCESSCRRRCLVDVYGCYIIADAFLINEAPRRQLLRLRKDDLVRLYAAAGLTEDAELLTKPEIVDCIVDSRDDIASLPPSSPPEPGSSGSSDYSSDGGNVAGGEETDIGNRFRNGLARRNTIHDLGQRNRRPLPSDRCYSLPQLQQSERVTRVASRSIPNGSRRYGRIPLFLHSMCSFILLDEGLVMLVRVVHHPQPHFLRQPSLRHLRLALVHGNTPTRTLSLFLLLQPQVRAREKPNRSSSMTRSKLPHSRRPSRRVISPIWLNLKSQSAWLPLVLGDCGAKATAEFIY